MTAADKIAEARALIEPQKPRNEGHGHVFPRPDGARVRCGGPPICNKCAADLARKPDLRDTVAALADLADAQAQENARLRAALQDALLQLQYLSTEQQRASTNGVMARIRNAIGETQ